MWAELNWRTYVIKRKMNEFRFSGWLAVSLIRGWDTPRGCGQCCQRFGGTRYTLSPYPGSKCAAWASLFWETLASRARIGGPFGPVGSGLRKQGPRSASKYHQYLMLPNGHFPREHLEGWRWSLKSRCFPCTTFPVHCYCWPRETTDPHSSLLGFRRMNLYMHWNTPTQHPSTLKMDEAFIFETPTSLPTSRRHNHPSTDWTSAGEMYHLVSSGEIIGVVVWYGLNWSGMFQWQHFVT
jgi:hypothetical protein